MPRKPSAGPGKGEGWGGPAKGARQPAPAFTRDSATRATIPGGRGDPAKMAARRNRREIAEERSRKLEDHLYRLALKAKHEETQVTAATKLHAIYQGQPVARNMNLNVDDVSQLSDDELRAEMARAGGASAAAAPGNAPEGVPPESDGVVH